VLEFSDRSLLERGVVGRAVVAMVEMDGAVGVGVGGGVEAARRWRLADERCDLRAMESEYVRRFHRHEPSNHQCSSAVAKHIKAPVHLVSSRLSSLLDPLAALLLTSPVSSQGKAFLALLAVS
jgi:lysozyme family protein